MAVKKSTRRISGLGGRPNQQIRHNVTEKETSSTVEPMSEKDDISPDDDIREAIRKLLTDNTAMLIPWLKSVGAENPSRALSLYKDLVEFVVPRLQRADGKIDPSSPVQIIFETTESLKKRKQNDD